MHFKTVVLELAPGVRSDRPSRSLFPDEHLDGERVADHVGPELRIVAVGLGAPAGVPGASQKRVASGLDGGPPCELAAAPRVQVGWVDDS
jgi:hypothetical protein